MTAPVDRLAAALADRYAIERQLGRGGMATVYLAEDLKHHRKVAIKILKDDVSATVGASRFLREIEIAAQLQHPNILPLLDSGEAGGVLYYVMPFIEGQSLRQRLAREGELPVGEAVRILVEVADALAYAHARGVVHRDIKPDNIMLTGRHALVADFGVARAVSEATGGGHTLTSLGVALGTPAYMAPEQAMADPHVDQRADLYALGVVAYELLTGRTPFMGASAQQVLAAHVTEKPDPVSRYRPGLAPALEHVVMRCLEKRPADRFQTAEEMLAMLEPLATPSGGTAPATVRLPAAAPAMTSGRGVWIAGVAALLGLVAFLFWRLTREGPAALELGRSTQVTSEAELEIHPDISPDGKLVAFSAGNFARMRIFIRPVGGGRTIPLSDDTSAVESAPRWSPDGSQILFLTRGGVSVAPALGGTSRPIAPPSALAGVTAAAWSPDGARVLFVRADSIFAAGADGSAPALLAVAAQVHSCAWSPRNDWIACVSGNDTAERPGANFGNLAPSAIVLVPARGGTARTIVEPTASSTSPVWTDGGDGLLFLSNRDGPRDIYRIGLTRAGQARGEAQRLTTGIGASTISLAGDGRRLAYSVYTARSNLWSLPIPTRAPVSAERATALTTGSQVVEAMRVSRDGRWIIYDSNLGGLSHIWRIPIAGGSPEKLTDGPAPEFAGDLSPDGRFIAYHSWRSGTRDIEVLSLAGGEAERVTDTPGQESYPVWFPDGTSILFVDQALRFTARVTTRIAGGGWSAPRSIATTNTGAALSPDGRWIAFNDATDPMEVRVTVAPVSGGPARVLYRQGPADPTPVNTHWSRDGRLVYFKAQDAAGRASFWSVGADGGRARLLVRFDDLSHPSSRPDFSVDDRRFYFPIEDRQSDVFVAEVVRK